MKQCIAKCRSRTYFDGYNYAIKEMEFKRFPSFLVSNNHLLKFSRFTHVMKLYCLVVIVIFYHEITLAEKNLCYR